MNESTLIMPEKGAARGKGRRVEALHGWAILGWIGLAFLIVGGADFALTWYPMDFGNREWEFGTVTQSFNGLPIVVLGLGLLLTSSVLTDRRWLALVAAIGALGLLLWVLAGVVLWLTTVPMALSGTPVQVLTGMKKAIARTAVQSVTYPVILGYLLWRAVGAMRGTIGSGRET